MTIEEKQQEIIDEFTIFEDWMDKYQYLVDLSKSLKPFPEEYRTDDNLIKGCQSRVWIFAVKKDGKINFYGDSDAIIVKGIVSLLINVFSGFTPEEILKADFNFIDEIGLKEHLSPTRSNGLLAMVKQMRTLCTCIFSALILFGFYSQQIETFLFQCGIFHYSTEFFRTGTVCKNRHKNTRMTFGGELRRNCSVRKVTCL